MSDNLREDVIYLTRCVELLRQSLDFLDKRLHSIERIKAAEDMGGNWLDVRTSQMRNEDALEALQANERETLRKVDMISRANSAVQESETLRKAETAQRLTAEANAGALAEFCTQLSQAMKGAEDQLEIMGQCTISAAMSDQYKEAWKTISQLRQRFFTANDQPIL